ncbi:MAG: ABC transporter substrate-binding protein [Alphaproteobacteria bacterium]|nr:ABC transporter substrate-binding protein [Alphaproteobacteria bacterium]
MMRISTALIVGIFAFVGSWTDFAMESSSGHAQEPQKVNYLLPAPPFLPAFGPWMLAQARGYYADEGLEVEFLAAKGGVDVAKQVGAGNAVVGGAIGDTPIIVRANGIPVKSVALLGGRSLTQLVAREGSGITGPAALKDRIVTTMSYQDTTYYALLGALASVGLTKDNVDIQGAGPAGVWKLFIAGESDAMSAVPDWIGIAQGQGVKVKIMPVEDYFKSMAQAILASDETIQNQPELIGKLVRATLHGMKDIMDDPAGAAVGYVKAMPQHAGKEKAMEAVFRLYNEYVYPGQEKLGAMDPERLASVQDFYFDQGIVRSKSEIGDLYTNEFIE